MFAKLFIWWLRRRRRRQLQKKMEFYGSLLSDAEEFDKTFPLLGEYRFEPTKPRQWGDVQKDGKNTILSLDSWFEGEAIVSRPEGEEFMIKGLPEKYRKVGKTF